MQTGHPKEQSPPLHQGQEQSEVTLPTTSSPIIQAQYELEFENPSSSWARKLFVDAERTLFCGLMSEVAITKNGHNACHSNSHNPQTASSLSYQQPSISSHCSSLGTYTSRPIQSIPEREKRKSEEIVPLLRQVPEDGEAMEFHSTAVSQNHVQQGNDDREDVETDGQLRLPTVSTPRYIGGHPLTVNDEDEEEEEWILEEELARRGLYRGSYNRIKAFYSLTPVFTLLVFITLAYLPKIAYPLPEGKTPGAPYHYSLLLPFPFPEILAATAFWALSHLLNSFIFSFFSSLLMNQPIFSLSLSSLIQSSLGVILRLTVIPILLIPRSAVFDHPTWHDISFRRTWWIALGWAAAEAVVGIKQGYDGIALYRDVLVSVTRLVSTPNQTPKRQSVSMSGYGSISQGSSGGLNALDRVIPNPRSSADIERRPLLERSSSSAGSVATQTDTHLKDTIEEEVERDVEELIALRGREELEDLYGMPFIHIPVFISCLHRLNTVLFVLGSTLLLTAAYLRSSLALLPSHPIHDHFANPSTLLLRQHWSGNTQLSITFPLIVILQWVLLLLHTPHVLPRIGVQTFVYVGFMVSLGVFFAGLGVWEGIV